MRILPMLRFYQQRIPVYARRRLRFRLILLFCGMLSAFLTRYGLLEWVACVVAFSSSVRSWVEFSDDAAKLQRYTNVVKQLKLNLNWWKGMTDVEKASTELIARLVLTT